jgi:hypothetical protein
MGSPQTPFGWGGPAVQDFVLEKIRQNHDISARDLARALVLEASVHDGWKPKDDITCGVIYFRKPRDLLVMTGPPLRPENDAEFARMFARFTGRKIVCGGTTANILSRELGLPVKVNLRNLDPKVPPFSEMTGADLVTEGIITMGSVAELLESGERTDNYSRNAATRIIDLFLDCDRIRFVVGTKINEAHQDPNMPVELEIRRNIVKKVAGLLQERYLKEVHIQYV